MFRGRVRHVHFVGVGGVGMSGLAEILRSLSFDVSGSDMRESSTTQRLAGIGVRIDVGHRAENVAGADVVVYSSAIKASNAELTEARALGTPVITRAEMLAELMRLKYGIAIAGSHGKTTTTSLIATVLRHAGFDPTAVIGGKLPQLGSNARLGQSDYLVAEAGYWFRTRGRSRDLAGNLSFTDFSDAFTYRAELGTKLPFRFLDRFWFILRMTGVESFASSIEASRTCATSSSRCDAEDTSRASVSTSTVEVLRRRGARSATTSKAPRRTGSALTSCSSSFPRLGSPPWTGLRSRATRTSCR